MGIPRSLSVVQGHSICMFRHFRILSIFSRLGVAWQPNMTRYEGRGKGVGMGVVRRRRKRRRRRRRKRKGVGVSV